MVLESPPRRVGRGQWGRAGRHIAVAETFTRDSRCAGAPQCTWRQSRQSRDGGPLGPHSCCVCGRPLCCSNLVVLPANTLRTACSAGGRVLEDASKASMPGRTSPRRPRWRACSPLPKHLSGVRADPEPRARPLGIRRRGRLMGAYRERTQRGGETPGVGLPTRKPRLRRRRGCRPVGDGRPQQHRRLGLHTVRAQRVREILWTSCA